MPRSLTSFGTHGGYDIEGGDQPICWNFTKTEGLKENAQSSFEIDPLSDNIKESLNFYQEADRRKGDMMEQCWDGLALKVEPPLHDALAVGLFYNFTASVKVQRNWTLSNGSNDTSISHRKDLVYLRLILCDVEGSGFCSPYHNSRDGSDRLVVEEAPFDDYGGNIHEKQRSNLTGSMTRNFFVEHSITTQEAETHFISTPFYALNISQGWEGEGGNRQLNVLKDNVGANVVLSLKVPISHEKKPRTFFVIAHMALLSLRDTPTTISQWVDIANAIPRHVVTYQDPIIQDNSRGFEMAFGLLLFFLVLTQLAFFISILKNRNNTVLELSQGSLLALLTATSAIATGACYFVMPLSDFFCNVCEPLTLIPGSLIGSILLGRIWRINAILSPALRMGLSDSCEDESSLMTKMKSMIMTSLNYVSLWENPFRSCRKRRDSGFRQMVSMRRLLRLIVILMIPQVLLQIFTLSCCKAERYVDLNEELTMGRYVCRRDHSWLMWVAYTIMSIPFLLTLILAASSSNLPSLFNETSGIFNAGLIICLSLVVGIPLIALTQSPVVSPDVMAFLTASLILSIMLTPPFFIVRPKLMWVWSGKKVIVNTMLRDGDMSDGYSGSERSANGYSFDVGEARNTGWPVPMDADQAATAESVVDATTATVGTVPSATSFDTERKTVIRFSDQVEENDGRSNHTLSARNVASSTTIYDDMDVEDIPYLGPAGNEPDQSVASKNSRELKRKEKLKKDPSVLFDVKHTKEDTTENSFVESVAGSARSLAGTDETSVTEKKECTNVSVPQHWTLNRIPTGDNGRRASSSRLSSIETSSLGSDDFNPNGGVSEPTASIGPYSNRSKLYFRAANGTPTVSFVGDADDFIPNPDLVSTSRADDFEPNPREDDDDFTPNGGQRQAVCSTLPDRIQGRLDPAQQREIQDDFIVNSMRPFRSAGGRGLRSGVRRLSTGTVSPTSNHMKDKCKSARLVSEVSKKSSMGTSQGLGLVVCSSKPLPSRLLKQLIAIKKLTTTIIHRCMAGERVPHSELQSLRSRGKKFGHTCANLVVEEDEDSEDGESKKSTGSKPKNRFSFMTR